MGMAIRVLRERIDLLKRKLEPDAIGGVREHWEKYQSTWARITPLYAQGAKNESAKSIRLGGKEIESPHYKIILSASVNRKAFQRIRWKKRTLALTTQPEYEPGQRFMVCYASELQEGERREYP
jgi:head-tail adaptor